MALVVVMEDDPEEGELFCELLEDAGFETRLFRDAHSALEFLEKNPADLLISDVFVRKGDRLVPDGGVRLISTIRQIWRADSQLLPIIAVSGGIVIQGGASPLRIARDLGADALFGKPVPIDELVLTIRELLGARIRRFTGLPIRPERKPRPARTDGFG